MTSEYIKYTCDICKKSFEVIRDPNSKSQYPKELNKIDIMGREFDCEGRNFSIGAIKCDICKECQTKLYEVTSKYFAIVDDCYGISADIKYE